MASSGPRWREGVFFRPDSSGLNHDGVDESNDGKAVIECEESLGQGTVDRSEIQMLTGANRYHGYTLGIREGSADGDTKGDHSHCTFYFLHRSSHGLPKNASARYVTNILNLDCP
jgi:hypothetical protein